MGVGHGGKKYTTALPTIQQSLLLFPSGAADHPSSIYFHHSVLLFNCPSLFHHSFTVFTIHAFSLYPSLTQKTSLHSCPRIVRAMAQWTITNELYEVRGGKWSAVDRLHTRRFMWIKLHFIIHKILKNICINFQLVKENVIYLSCLHLEILHALSVSFSHWYHIAMIWHWPVSRKTDG